MRAILQEERLKNEITDIFVNQETELSKWAKLLQEAIRQENGSVSRSPFQSLPTVCDWIIDEVSSTEEFSTSKYSANCAVMFETSYGAFMLVEKSREGITFETIYEKKEIELINDLKSEVEQTSVVVDKVSNSRMYNVYIEISAEPWIVMSFNVLPKDR